MLSLQQSWSSRETAGRGPRQVEVWSKKMWRLELRGRTSPADPLPGRPQAAASGADLGTIPDSS